MGAPNADSALPCVFCEIVAKRTPAEIVATYNDEIVIRPLNPVTEGHLLVIPRRHVANAKENPAVTGKTFQRAAQFGTTRLDTRQFNLITSNGPDATQTVMHLHVHIVPRRPGDGLALPWTPAQIDSSGPAS